MIFEVILFTQYLLDLMATGESKKSWLMREVLS